MFHVKPFEPKDYVEITKGLPNWLDMNPLEMGILYKRRGLAYSGFCNGELVICAGVGIPWKGLGEVWAVLSPHAPKCHLSINRAAKRFLWAMIKEADLRRVQAQVDLSFTKGLKWLEWLGFKFDGVSEKYGPNGEDFVRYVLFPSEVKHG